MVRGPFKQAWKHPSTVLLVIFLFHAITNYIVIIQDTAPFITDEAMYFSQSGTLFKGVYLGNSRMIADSLQGSRPPLQSVLSLPFFFLFGYSPDVALLSYLLSSVVLLISVFSIGKALEGEGAGLLAAAFTVLLPGIFAFSRTYYQDYPLTAMVSLSLALLLKTHHFSIRKYTFAFGMSVALGLLAKWTYSAFVIGPFLVYVYSSHKEISGLPKGQRQAELLKRGGWLLFSVLLGLLVAAPWYMWNLRYIAHDVGLGAFGTDPQFHPIVRENLTYIFKQLFTNQLRGFFFVLVFASAIYLGWRRSLALLFLLSWLVISYALFTVVIMTTTANLMRYALACLPAFSLLIGIACAVLPKRVRRISVFILLAFGILQLVVLSYAVRTPPPLHKFNSGRAYADRRDFHTDEIVSILNTLLKNTSNPQVLVKDHIIYSGTTLEYLQLMGMLVPFWIEDTGPCSFAGYCFNRSIDTYVELFEHSDAVLVEGRQGDPTTMQSAHSEYVRFQIAWNETASSFKPIRMFELPEQHQLVIYTRADS